MMIAISVILIVIDQITKYLTVSLLKPIGNVDIIPGVLSFTYVENKGAAFGMMQNARWIFIIVTIAVLIGLAIYIIKSKPKEKLFKWSATLIVAGAVGNMIDRLFAGFVIDMIHATFIDFPVFNFADCCVVIGTILLCIHILIKKD